MLCLVSLQSFSPASDRFPHFREPLDQAAPVRQRVVHAYRQVETLQLNKVLFASKCPRDSLGPSREVVLKADQPNSDILTSFTVELVLRNR